MANLPFFWQSWVVVLTILGLVFLSVLVWSVYFSKEEPEEQIIWDGDLEEGSASAPMWWFWLIASALFFSVIYIMVYPSLGNYNGLFDLTKSRRYIESKENIDNKYSKKLAVLAAADYQTLQDDPNAMRLAGNIFSQNCAACHAEDARGQRIFPNLVDKDWLWGNKPEQITHSISLGRRPVMPAWGAVLGDQGVSQVADYIKSVGNKSYNETKHAEGKLKYQQFCVACHTPNLTGNVLLGAPNLSDDIWLYGSDLDSIKASIALGRQGVMPAHQERLSALQIKLLTAWLLQK